MQGAEAEAWPSLAQLEQEGMTQMLDSEAAGQLQQHYTYLYAQAADLRMDDVPVLLRQYKELILKHEAVACAIQMHRARQPSGSHAKREAPSSGNAANAAALVKEGVVCGNLVKHVLNMAA